MSLSLLAGVAWTALVFSVPEDRRGVHPSPMTFFATLLVVAAWVEVVGP